MSRKLLEGSRVIFSRDGRSRSVHEVAGSFQSIFSRDGKSSSVPEVAGIFKSILCRVGRSSSRKERSRKLLEASRAFSAG